MAMIRPLPLILLIFTVIRADSGRMFGSISDLIETEEAMRDCFRALRDGIELKSLTNFLESWGRFFLPNTAAFDDKQTTTTASAAAAA